MPRASVRPVPRLPLGTLAALAVALGCTPSGRTGDAGADADSGPPQVLCSPEEPGLVYVTHAAGYRHAVLPHSVEVLRRLAGEVGLGVHHFEDARRALRPGGYEDCVAVVFYTSGELPLAQADRTALLAWIRAGGTFAGFHSATDTFYEWPEYGAMVGAYFDGHPWHTTVRIEVTEPTHPAVRSLPGLFPINDEIYQFRDFADDARVLLRLDTSSVDLSANGVRRRPWGFPLAWSRREGSGRVFYTALGHGAAWDDPNFETLLRGVLGWLVDAG